MQYGMRYAESISDTLSTRQPDDLRNGEVLCFLCGADWILKYYLDELRLQMISED
jgi:hypothetical protein